MTTMQRIARNLQDARIISQIRELAAAMSHSLGADVGPTLVSDDVIAEKTAQALIRSLGAEAADEYAAWLAEPVTMKFSQMGMLAAPALSTAGLEIYAIDLKAKVGPERFLEIAKDAECLGLQLPYV